MGRGLASMVSASRTPLTYHTDGLGSVRALSDAAGSAVQGYQTDEFGMPTERSGPSGQPFGYTGEVWDPETGLLNLRARLYDPAIGRFLQRDSFAGWAGVPQSLNRYSYVGNNPVTFTDPSGHAFPLALAGAVACAASAGCAAIVFSGLAAVSVAGYGATQSGFFSAAAAGMYDVIDEAGQAANREALKSAAGATGALISAKQALRSLGVLPPPGSDDLANGLAHASANKLTQSMGGNKPQGYAAHHTGPG